MKKIVIAILLVGGLLHGSVNRETFTWDVPKKNILRKVSVDADLNQFNRPFLLSDEVVQYVEDIISILQENSVNRKEVDWNKFRYQFYSKVNGCSFFAQTHPKI